MKTKLGDLHIAEWLYRGDFINCFGIHSDVISLWAPGTVVKDIVNELLC